MAKYRGKYQEDLDKEEKPYSEEVQATQVEVEPTDPEEITYKKRHGDLRKHLNQLAAQKNKEIDALKTQLSTATQKQIKFPKTDAEIDEWSAKFPDVAKIVDTIARKRATEATQETEKKLASLRQMEQQITKERAQNELFKDHPDFAQIKANPEFQEWVKLQPEYIHNALIRNSSDARAASRALDLYKADLAKEGKKVSSPREAAQAIGRTSETVKPTTKGKAKYSESQVAQMSSDEYEKHEDAILQSMRDETFDYDQRRAAS